ncbi:MAG: serine/threonine protein kinase [Candidatus Obscuribacterales bacterium]|nr:serine/threonine protein kinase [Candidatus Obscuribacterales bacterium]
MNSPENDAVKTAAAKAPVLPARYEFIKFIGEGASGQVVLASDKYLSRQLAIKIVSLSAERGISSAQNFLGEAKALALLDHPNIVKVHSVDIGENGLAYLSMEYLVGEPLDQILASHKLHSDQFYQLFKQVLSGLEFAHEHGIVHRDLKPANIMLCESESGSFIAKIIDFGIARLNDDQDSQATRTRVMVGSPAYMSPEQCFGHKTDHRSDIYSIACVMYECLVGKAPFSADSDMELMYKQSNEQAPSIIDTAAGEQPLALARLIESCLEKDPNKRPQSLREIQEKLDSIFDEGSITFRLFRDPEKRAKANLAWLLAAILLFSVFAVAKLIIQTHNPKNPALEIEEEKKRLEQRTIEREQSELNQAISRWQYLRGDDKALDLLVRKFRIAIERHTAGNEQGKAILLIDQALGLLKGDSGQEKYERSILLQMKARIYRGQNNWQESTKLLEQSLNTALSVGSGQNSTQIINVKLELLEALVKIGKPAKAQKYFLECANFYDPQTRSVEKSLHKLYMEHAKIRPRETKKDPLCYEIYYAAVAAGERLSHSNIPDTEKLELAKLLKEFCEYDLAHQPDFLPQVFRFYKQAVSSLPPDEPELADLKRKQESYEKALLKITN